LRNDRLLKIAAATFKARPSALGPDTAIGTIESWDSLTHLELVFRLEEEFGVRFPMQKIVELKTLGQFETELDRLRGVSTD